VRLIIEVGQDSIVHDVSMQRLLIRRRGDPAGSGVDNGHGEVVEIAGANRRGGAAAKAASSETTRVAHSATVVSDTGFIGPHWAPRESVPAMESYRIGPGKPYRLMDSKDSLCSRTDTQAAANYSLRVFGQVGISGNMLESQNSGPDA
jgi:hypothetical protein